MKAWLVPVLFVATIASAGCADSGQPTQAPTESLSAPAGVESGGTIQGSIVNEEMQLVVGAEVALLRTEFPTQTTDEQGRFRFDGVPGGTHSILAQALGYETATKSVTVVEGEPVDVTLALRAIAVAVPRQQTFFGDGYIDVAFNVYDQQLWPIVVNVTGYRRNWFLFDLDADAVSVVTLVAWTPASAAGVKYMEHTGYVAHKGVRAGQLNYTKGPSPLSIRHDDLADAAGGKKFQINPGFRLMPCDTGCPPEAQVQVALEQRVKLYAAVFYVDVAPADYKVPTS